MKAAIFALALPALALAGGAESSWAAGAPSAAPVAPHISVTVYDAPYSSGDKTWAVHTTVSYSVGPSWTSMITGPPAPTSTASGWGHSSAPVAGSSSGWGSSPAVATPTPSPKPYTGGAAQAVAGAGALVAGALAYVL